MKTKAIFHRTNSALNIFFVFLFFICLPTYAADIWCQQADVGPTTLRRAAVAFSIGTRGYIGTGWDGTTEYQDFWEWTQGTNVWTQKANFGGGARHHAKGFSIGTKGYIGTGWSNSTATDKQDFWEWDQATNTWTAKANFPGTPRHLCGSFSIGTKGYLGMGIDNTSTQKVDFYEWDQGTNTWAAKTNFAGSMREGPAAFSIGAKGYFGTGWNGTTAFSEFWEWDQATNTWTAKANYGGGAIREGAGFSIGTKGYIGTGREASGANRKDFWEWCPGTPCCTLPVDLLSFTGSYDGKQAKLLWATAAESNNNFFTVERSTDAINFISIGTVKGAGNSSSTKNYSFPDPTAEVIISKSQTVYYRLKQTDYNGDNRSYPPISVELIPDGPISVYPNPTSGKISVSIRQTAGGNVSQYKIEIYNLFGEKIFTSATSRSQSTIDISSQSIGVYFLKVIYPDGSSVVDKIIRD